MHIEDAGAALVALLNSDLQGPCNICSGQAVPIADIVKMLAEISGSRQLARMGALPDRADELIGLSADNARLRSTGWELTIPLSAGLVRTFAWWQSNLMSIPAKSTGL
jgi:nucleoside-diphosphate-sugar epimerase